MRKLAVCFATLCMLAGPALATPQPARAPALVEKAPAKKPANPDELQQYAMREKVAEKLEKFEGGRGRGIETGTIIVILLVVIIVILVI